MFRTEGNLQGIGPPSRDTKGEVWVIRGYNFPVILLRQEDGSQTVISDCYVHGIMHGEVLDKPDAKLEKVILVQTEQVSNILAQISSFLLLDPHMIGSIMLKYLMLNNKALQF